MSSTLPGESLPQPADEAQALRDEIEKTRERLGDTPGRPDHLEAADATVKLLCKPARA